MQNQKKMSLFDLTFMAIGGIIGAGIFSMVGTGIATTGRSVALALVVGMIFTMSQQIRYIFTSSMFQLSGGMYSQNALVLSPFMSGVSGIVTTISSVSFSVFGISMAQYLSDLFPVLAPYQVPVACLVLVLFFVLGSTGAEIFAKAINALGILKFIALALFIGFGLTKVQMGGFEGEPYFINGSVSFLTAVALMSFTCNGATNIINVQGIAENPKKNIPKAFFIASILVAGVYFLLGFVASSIAPYSEVAGQNLGFMAEMVLPGPLFIFFIVGGAMFALATTLNSQIMSCTKPVMQSCEDGWFPTSLATLSKFKTPYKILIIYYIILVVPILLDLEIAQISSIVQILGYVNNLILTTTAMKLPKMFPEAWEKSAFRVPTPVFYALMIIADIAILIQASFMVSSMTIQLIVFNVAVLAAGFIWALYRTGTGKAHPTVSYEMA